MIAFLTVFKWVSLLLLSVCGMVILATDPAQQSLGLMLALGCFLVFALDVARTFID
jgi:hypothetical protein|tara:strand:- start:375 stop:542 length:168 start_codon:yes stop_codon:yes gene_type:complete